MGVEKLIRKPGNGADYPSRGDNVTIEYTGYLLDPSKQGKKGEEFDSSVNRGDFVTQIGQGMVIKGEGADQPTFCYVAPGQLRSTIPMLFGAGRGKSTPY
ncbi:MAG: FK506 binding protein proline rotamase rapamycin-binding protein [Caeruleum heppii]|nr:MAG: FK506 binding protein proline rotamase rapamycin-binding protein [Caeruleum heppii]